MGEKESEFVAAIGVVAEADEAVAVVDRHCGLAEGSDANEVRRPPCPRLLERPGVVEGDDVLDFLREVGEFEGDLVGGVDLVDLAADAFDW